MKDPNCKLEALFLNSCLTFFEANEVCPPLICVETRFELTNCFLVKLSFNYIFIHVQIGRVRKVLLTCLQSLNIFLYINFSHHYILLQTLQKDEPQIHRVHKILVNQLSAMLSKLLKPDVILQAKDITKFDLKNKEHHKNRPDIQIGFKCKEYLKEKYVWSC